MKKKFIFIFIVLLLIGILFIEYFYLKGHQEVVYINSQEECSDISDSLNDEVKTKVIISEKEQINTGYHINNDASENMLLENTINNIIVQTSGENP